MDELTAYHKDVIAAKICPYCKSKTRPASELEIYKKKYSGRSMVCCINWPTCDSYVGCHPDGSPMGRLAQWPLRMEKKKTHEKFDRLWRDKLMDRDSAYEEMADHLEIDDEYCHIGYFGTKTCKKAQKWAIEKYFELVDG